jgi:hypothetical protein
MNFTLPSDQSLSVDDRGKRSTFDFLRNRFVRVPSDHDPHYLYSDDKHSGSMDSELRKTLLKAPSTSVSTALVSSLDTKPGSSECAINAKFLPSLLSSLCSVFIDFETLAHGIADTRVPLYHG